MKTINIRSLVLTSIVCVLALGAGNAMAFSIAPSGSQSEAGDGGGGFDWWSRFQDTMPRQRRADGGSLPDLDRPTGRWFQIKRASILEGRGIRIFKKFDVESLGFDRHARMAFAKDRFLKNFVLGWRFNRFFAQQEAAPAPIPLPAPLLLLGSALAGLLTFSRRMLRRKGHASAE